MKIFKNIKNIEVYKFGVISPVLYEPGIRQNQYFRGLSKHGIEIPPGSRDIYYLHVSTYKGWLKKYNESGLEGLKEKTRIDKGCYRKLTCEIIQGINQVMEKTDVVSVKDLERKRWVTSGESMRIRPCSPGPLKKRLPLMEYPKYYIVTRAKYS
jgi:hypothetical protein